MKTIVCLVSLMSLLTAPLSYAQDTTFVDLGLSVKWAACNLGAESPEQYGNYYAWGEVETKDEYSLSTYKWSNGAFNKFTKYYYSGRNGKADKTVLDPEDDAAHIWLGGKSRIPTKMEMDELIDNCDAEGYSINGVIGMKFTSKINGRSIFLPAAGNYVRNTLYQAGEDGYYLSSSLAVASHLVEGLFFYEKYFWEKSYAFRFIGGSIRPVSD